MRMRTRRKWWLWGTQVALSSGRLRVCGSRPLPLRLRRGGGRACPRAAGWAPVAWGGPAATWGPSGPIWPAAVGEGGAGLLSSPSGLGGARVLQWVRLCGLASAGGNSSRGLHSGAGGGGPGVSGLCARGACGSLGRMGVLWGVGPLAVGVCGLSGVGGGEGCSAGGSVAGACGSLGGGRRPVLRGPGVRAMAGVCGPSGGMRGGAGRGGDCGRGVCCVGVCVGFQRRTCAVSCRPVSLEAELAVFCRRGKDFADERA